MKKNMITATTAHDVELLPEFIDRKAARELNGWHVLSSVKKGGYYYWYMTKGSRIELFYRAAIAA